jgi:hypothetical protein
MPDVFAVAKRSEIMRAIRGKDTEPELLVRRLLYSLGYRFRTSPPRPSRLSRHCVCVTEEGHLHPRMLLAPAQLPEGSLASRNAQTILADQAITQSRT